jgi:hypothetical protein
MAQPAEGGSKRQNGASIPRQITALVVCGLLPTRQKSPRQSDRIVRAAATNVAIARQSI